MAQPSPNPAAATARDHIASQQLDAVFGTILVGVMGAALGGWLVVHLLAGQGAIGETAGYGWATYISVCAALHIALGAARRLVRPQEADWRLWARLFSVVCLFEGIGWGLLPIMIALSGNFTFEMVTLTVSLVIVTASITAFSPYFPAFVAFLLPSTVPYFVWAGTVPDVQHRSTAGLMLVFIVAIFQLAWISSRRYRRMLVLQIEKDEQVRLAASANAQLSTFLAMASHELRTPAQDLSNRAATLATNPALSGNARRDAEDIHQRSQLINEMFGAMLNLSLLDAGKKTPNKRDLLLGPILRAICDESRKEAQRKGLDLRLVTTSVAVQSDGPMLSVIVSNLVRNAIRHTAAGKILVGVRVRRGAGTVVIQVLDSGPGIRPADQQQIFGAFYQVEGAATKAAEGAGLGLAIVQRFASLLNARLGLQSEVGRGTKFEVAVPLVTAPIDLAADGEARMQASRFVAVVDDNDAIIESATALLRSWGHRVISATSGDGIVAALSKEALPPDLIISDYQLQNDENGIEVIERLRSEYNDDIPGLLLTGDTTDETQAAARQSGIPILHAPVPDKNLRAAVSGLTARRREPADWFDQIKPAS